MERISTMIFITSAETRPLYLNNLVGSLFVSTVQGKF